MAKQQQSYKKQLVKSLKARPLRFWRKNTLHKIFCILVLVVFLLVLFMYAVAEWYIKSESHIPLQMGVSFIPDYAATLGLNPEQTMDALIGIGVKQFRLVSYWNDIEPAPGHYDFSQLDWEFKKIEAVHGTVTLTLGLRQPRWPECHAPSWVNISSNQSQWEPQLEKAMAAVVNRYKNSPSLEKYQLENEYFLQGFGNCTNDNRDRFVREFKLVKKLDPKHPILIARSNNAIGFPIGQPHGDEYGISVYKRVWDAGVTHRYIEYPYPAWYYAFLAGFQKIFLHRDMIVDELQAEAWPPDGKNISEISLSEQNKSMNAKRLQDRFNYGKATGMKQIELWGAEYWYYRKTVLHDPSLWNVAQQEFLNQCQG